MSKIGLRYGRLLVIERSSEIRCGYLCQCDCGNTKIVYASSLTSGDTRSCGCLRKEISSNKVKTHGLSYSRIYRIWTNINRRCYDSGFTQYKDWGGRGIGVCNEWRVSFMNFVRWAYENGYSEKLHIDRKNNDGDYTPENCRFVSQKINNRNRRTVKLNMVRAWVCRKLYSEGIFKQTELGLIYGVSKFAINKVIKGVNWQSS